MLIWCLFWYYVLIVNFQNFPVHIGRYADVVNVEDVLKEGSHGIVRFQSLSLPCAISRQIRLRKYGMSAWEKYMGASSLK